VIAEAEDDTLVVDVVVGVVLGVVLGVSERVIGIVGMI
jgi:hypothetical protein